jgi:hypothetical protein
MASENKPAGGAAVSMRKEPKGATARSPQVPRITPPRTIDLACAALGVTIGALVLRGLLLLGYTGTLQNYLISVNRKADKPKKHYGVGSSALNADLHQLRQATLVNVAVVAVALLLLIFALRRTRSASGSRWALLIVVVFTQLPAYVIPISGGWPAVPQAFGVLAGIASIAALVLVFVKPSMQYFRTCRESYLPPDRLNQPRPGLASLFGPRPPRTAPARGGATTRGFAATRPENTANPAAAKPAAGKAKAKVRADAEAVSRGAELARSRAKASKSRRSER